MRITTELQYATLDDLYLDAKNPRIGRHQTDANLSQEEILGMMGNWDLDELAMSYLENGFWRHEALLVVKEESDGEQRFVVVDGNRRVAALIYLRHAINGKEIFKGWAPLVENKSVPEKLFEKIPYIQIHSRQEVESFQAFHHGVTGIKQWFPTQKSEYIAKLIDEQGMSYEDVNRMIGSSISRVRYHYISYRLLRQMEDVLEGFSAADAEFRFITMSFSIQTLGVQKYLGFDIFAEPDDAKTPVPKHRLGALANFARWLFGTQQHPPLLTGSRNAADFGRLLENPQAVQYLENNKQARFDVAWQLAYGDEEIIQLIDEAHNKIVISLSHIHHYKDSPEVQRAVEKLAINSKELLSQFPSIRADLLEDN
ncbi:MAG: ParB/Srx family N-terminal domain-containing protein [Candidatus Poribacteria bacterium]|nr:ParB/Srx family N-terminal domain-containing protein [Candidatus Poribacteria bacterium]